MEKDEHKAPSNRDCDANREFPILKIKYERKAPSNGDSDTIMIQQADTSRVRQVKKEGRGGRGGRGYGGGGYRG